MPRHSPLQFLTAITIACLYCSSQAFAGIGSYLSSYRGTLEWRSGAASADLRYNVAKQGVLPDRCQDHVSDSTLMSCTTNIGSSQKASYAFGIEQAFKRQGNFYFNADIGGSFFLLDAKAEEDRATTITMQPLQHARLHLYGMHGRAYLQFGVTPEKILPDLLISLGLGHHFSGGNIKIDNVREQVRISTGLGFAQFEVVWWRFKDGSLSSYVSSESGGSHRLAGDYKGYSELNLEPAITSFGVLKLVIPYKFQ